MQAWSPEEDHLIIDGVKMHGHQWRLIVQQLPGRSVSSTRNRFNRIEKGRHMQEEGKRGRNLCHACWLPKKGHICTKKMNGGPHVVKQTIVVTPSTNVVATPPTPLARAPEPAQAAAPAPSAPNAWAKPVVQRGSSFLSALSSDDLSELFGHLAKADAAAAGAEAPLLPTAGAPAPPAALPMRVDAHSQLEADAPPALLRLASADAAPATGWAPPMLMRSLSSFFKGASFLLADGPEGLGGGTSGSSGGSFLSEDDMRSLVSVSKSSSEASI